MMFLASATGGRPTPAGEIEEFPAFGVKIEVPAGWTLVPPTRSGHVAQWARLKDHGTKADDVVALEYVPLTEHLSYVGYAKALAKELKGEINQEVKMGGLPAVEVRAQRRSEEKTPRQIRVTAHRGHLWILSFWASGKGSYAMHTIVTMADSISWIPIAPASDHLEVAPAPTLITTGNFLARLPKIARPMPVDDPKNATRFGIYDLARSAPEFYFQAQNPESSIPQDMASAKTQFAHHISRTFPELSTLQWNDKKLASAEAALLSPVVLKEAPGEPPVRQYHYALLFHDKSLLVLSFSLTTWRPEAEPKYRALIGKILESIEFPGTAPQPSQAGSTPP